ncbi:helix-turn-helix domain-containing protein [Brevibacterium metallidurans]|uniref:Helix-turn-helix domain-containing protein n=1 Tax=Brevibacterium metallidurans TaxID=1482676 RepID=A0ABN0SRI2_9MICO
MGYTTPPKSDLSHYVNLTEAVQLGYGAYQTLRRYITQGKLPAVKIGGRVKVLRADLDALAVPKPARSFESMESAAERVVASSPPLSDEQIRRLRALLGGAK